MRTLDEVLAELRAWRAREPPGRTYSASLFPRYAVGYPIRFDLAVVELGTGEVAYAREAFTATFESDLEVAECRQRVEEVLGG